jgi:signal recognition particle receptor subunit beta
MSIINFKNREISCKIVYYGPSWGGKTTSIQAIHEAIPQQKRSKLQAIDTEGDRTLFFEQFAVDLGDCGGMNVRFMVYGVPGQIYYKSTRKTVLQGCDGIVFVADSEATRMDENVESLQDMKELLAEHAIEYASLPLVIQYNKRDLQDIFPVEQLEQTLNLKAVPSFETVAIESKGVQEAFKAICNEVVEKLKNEYLSKT